MKSLSLARISISTALLLLIFTAGLATQRASLQSRELRNFVNMINGTWVLESRISHGKPTQTTAHMYFDMNVQGDQATGALLKTEGGILDSFVSPLGDNQPFLIGGMFDVTMAPDGGGGPIGGDGASFAPQRQRRPSGITVKSSGEIEGSYGEFRKGIPFSETTTFVRRGNSYMKVDPVESPSGVEKSTDLWTSIVLSPDKLVYQSAKLNLTDTYRRISKDKPLVAGVWPLKEFWGKLKSEKMLLSPPQRRQ